MCGYNEVGVNTTWMTTSLHILINTITELHTAPQTLPPLISSSYQFLVRSILGIILGIILSQLLQTTTLAKRSWETSSDKPATPGHL